MFTGHPEQVLKLKPDHPDLMCIAHRERSDPGRRVPTYVGVNPIPYLGSAYLGPAYEPFARLRRPERAELHASPGSASQTPAEVDRLGGRHGPRGAVRRAPPRARRPDAVRDASTPSSGRRSRS